MDRHAQRVSPPRAGSTFARAAVTGGVAAIATGGLAGYLWMLLFPRPDFRLPETPVLAGILIGMLVGPIIGVMVAARRKGEPGARRAGCITTLVWLPVAYAFPFVVNRFVEPFEGPWVLIPIAVLLLGAMVASGAIVGRLAARRSAPSDDGPEPRELLG